MHDLDRTLRTYDTEGDFEFEPEMHDESPLSEEEEMELAAELLTLSEEAELDQFLGKLLKKAGKFVKPLAKTLLPIAGKVAGGFFGGPLGATIGGKLGTFATKLFEVDMESMAPEEGELAAARHFIRLAAAAADRAATAPPHADPMRVARYAVTTAARTYAPGLVRRRRAAAGRWMRRGNRIYVYGV